MFSWGLLAAGGLCILLAFIPTSWIGKAAITLENSSLRSMTEIASLQESDDRREAVLLLTNSCAA
jgi:hypothetical protein